MRNNLISWKKGISTVPCEEVLWRTKSYLLQPILNYPNNLWDVDSLKDIIDNWEVHSTWIDNPNRSNPKRDNPMEVSKEQLQVDIGRPLDDSDEKTLIVHGDVYNLDKGSIKGSNVVFGDELSGGSIKAGGNVKSNPKRDKPTLEEFRKWVELVNMKNKELKAFYDSDWFAASGLTPKEAKAQGIKLSLIHI